MERFVRHLRSPRGLAALLVLTAAIIAFAPATVEAYCYPCGNHACMFPDGICRSEGSGYCQPNTSGPGTYFFCASAPCFECCPYIQTWSC
jgi:hypothetical protein